MRVLVEFIMLQLTILTFCNRRISCSDYEITKVVLQIKKKTYGKYIVIHLCSVDSSDYYNGPSH